MNFFPRFRRAIRSLWPSARLGGCLIAAVWLAFVQPGMSYFGLIDPAVHAQIDAELYGQRPDGETLPGQDYHLPHEHSTSPGITVSGLTLINPFDTAFYRALLSPAERLALQEQRLLTEVIAQAIALAPPDQPPRLAKYNLRSVTELRWLNCHTALRAVGAVCPSAVVGHPTCQLTIWPAGDWIPATSYPAQRAGDALGESTRE